MSRAEGPRRSLLASSSVNMTEVKPAEDEGVAITDGGVVPVWVWGVAAALLVASLAVYTAGRGGAAALVAIALAFGALAVVLACVPDVDPAAEDKE